jgi:hypothetical protein
MSTDHRNEHLRQSELSRRAFLRSSGALAAAAPLGASTLRGDGQSSFANPLSAVPAPLLAKAKNVIFLFMYGGPSHMDTFDYKPKLYPLDGKTIDVKTRGRGGTKSQGRVVGPKWSFKQYGECGQWVSTLFPHLRFTARRCS